MIIQTAVDLIDLGNVARNQGNAALARWHYEESLIIWHALGDEAGVAHALAHLRRLDDHPSGRQQALLARRTRNCCVIDGARGAGRAASARSSGDCLPVPEEERPPSSGGRKKEKKMMRDQ